MKCRVYCRRWIPSIPIGLSTTKVETEDHRKAIRVADDSAAQKSGFEMGDVLLEDVYFRRVPAEE